MSPFAIVLLVYVSLGMLKLAYVLYGSPSKDVQQLNSRIFEQIRAAGPAAMLLGMIAEILLWPYGLWLGHHVAQKMARERQEASTRTERRAKEDLARIGKGPFDDTLQPTYHRAPGEFADLSEELKARIAEEVRRKMDEEGEELS